MFLTFGCHPSVVRGRGQLRDGLTRPCGRLWCPLAVIWEINVSSGSLQCLPQGRNPATLTCSEVSTWIWLCSELFGLEARCPPQSLGCPVTSASVFIPKMELRCLGTEKQTDRTRTQGFPGTKTEHQSVLKRSVYVPDLMQPQAAVFWGLFVHLKFSFHFILCPQARKGLEFGLECGILHWMCPLCLSLSGTPGYRPKIECSFTLWARRIFAH